MFIAIILKSVVKYTKISLKKTIGIPISIYIYICLTIHENIVSIIPTYRIIMPAFARFVGHSMYM